MDINETLRSSAMRTQVLLLALCLTLAEVCACAQQPEKQKIRVFVTDSQSWEISGGFGDTSNAAAGHVRGGARPQTSEIIKTFGERCPEITVTNNREKADYIILLDHEGGKGALRHRNKIVLFNRDGDAIFSHSTLSLGNSVKDACEPIKKDQEKTFKKP
jgi:hypothetical protein